MKIKKLEIGSKLQNEFGIWEVINVLDYCDGYTLKGKRGVINQATWEIEKFYTEYTE